jgi:hypothetical protein
MIVNIEFNTDNAAFEDSFLMAVTKTLQQAKEALLDSENTTTIRRPLKDINGNRIGVISISHDVPVSQL